MSDEEDFLVERDEFRFQLEFVRPVTRNLISSILLDEWPNQAAIVDFGLDSQEHYEALYHPIREHEIMPKELDDALGHGEKLTALARNAPSNRHKDITFHTSWDGIYGRDSRSASVSTPLPSPSEIADGKNSNAFRQGGNDELLSPSGIVSDSSRSLSDPTPGHPNERGRGKR
jgi:hypothetical protein